MTTREEQRREIAMEAQSACDHDPQPVPDADYIKRCPKCGKIFGKHEAEMLPKIIVAKSKD